MWPTVWALIYLGAGPLAVGFAGPGIGLARAAVTGAMLALAAGIHAACFARGHVVKKIETGVLAAIYAAFFTGIMVWLIAAGLL